MFAIETIVEDSLYAIRYEGTEDDEFENNEFQDDQSKKDEFRRLFSNWTDPEYLDAFFTKNQTDLHKDFFDFISIEDAILLTIEEAGLLEQELIDIAENGKNGNHDTLQTLFKPLNNREESIYPIPDYQKSKAYGNERKSWLRIYAIRIDKNVFVVTGGAIKLTANMNDRDHLTAELNKLDLVKRFLIEEDIIDNESIVDYLEL